MSGHTPSTNHKVIWLEPHCVPAGEQREWCEDNAWENGCPDCGVMPTKYVRADAHDALVEALEEARGLLAREGWTDKGLEFIDSRKGYDTMRHDYVREHVLKCWPEYFDAIEAGVKPFDVRRDDRGFQRGDTLLLQRYKIGDGYTPTSGGRFARKELRKRITYILTGGQFGIEPGYVVLGLADIEATT
jgi:predicted  nucleic acid-binding Zn-ribbon protein